MEKTEKKRLEEDETQTAAMRATSRRQVQNQSKASRRPDSFSLMTMPPWAAFMTTCGTRCASAGKLLTGAIGTFPMLGNTVRKHRHLAAGQEISLLKYGMTKNLEYYFRAKYVITFCVCTNHV